MADRPLCGVGKADKYDTDPCSTYRSRRIRSLVIFWVPLMWNGDSSTALGFVTQAGEVSLSVSPRLRRVLLKLRSGIKERSNM